MFRTATAAQHTNGSAFGISFERTSFEKITSSDGIIRPLQRIIKDENWGFDDID